MLNKPNLLCSYVGDNTGDHRHMMVTCIFLLIFMQADIAQHTGDGDADRQELPNEKWCAVKG